MRSTSYTPSVKYSSMKNTSSYAINLVIVVNRVEKVFVETPGNQVKLVGLVRKVQTVCQALLVGKGPREDLV